MSKTYYMIGNAHLDPVWQWQWTEGYAETKATFRSALDRMSEYDDFIFVCSSASIYEWIEECAPSMFEEIKNRVEEKRWIIVGGWWVQPDCNIPSGESFARHSLYSQNYFYNKFGVTSKVGYNVDSFGHNYMIPQILKKSGMDYYVFMRPGEHEKHMDDNVFNWVSPDGSKVLTYRLRDPYCNNFQSVQNLENTIKNVTDYGYGELDEMMVFYGVGNHGGGPTIKNIEAIKELDNEADYKLLLSDPETYFKKLLEKGYKIDDYTDDLQHHASGCYSACSIIKTLNRKCETKLTAAEKYSVMANVISNKKYPLEKFTTAWKNTLFNQFHDSLGGCSIKSVYDDAALSAGEALSIAAKSENGALQTLSWQIDTMSRDEYPVVIFNPHSWDIETEIIINRQCGGILDNNGMLIPSQLVHSPTESCTRRKDTLFKAKIPALGYTVYYMTDMKYDGENSVICTENTIENKYLKIVFEPHTGYIKEMIDKEKKRNILNGYGAVPVVIDEYEHDTWSHARNFFTKYTAKFSDAKLEIIDSGPVRATLKVTSMYNDSKLIQYFSLGYDSEKLDVRATIDWHEKHKMLKIKYPVNTVNPRAFYEIPFGWIERPCDGEEESGLQWIMLRGDDMSAAMLNDNKYSFSVKDNEMMLTVVRSPIYGDHGGPRTSESEFTDQGSHDFSYSIMPLESDTGFAAVTKAAREFNTPPTHIIENRHEGSLPQSSTGINVRNDNIIVSALKMSEDENGFIIRAYEVGEADTHAYIELLLLDVKLESDFKKHEVKTFYVDKNTKKIREVLFTESDA